MTLKTDMIEAMARAIDPRAWQVTVLELGLRSRDEPEEEARTRKMAEKQPRRIQARRKAKEALTALQSHCTPLGIKLTARDQTEEVKDLAVVYGWKDAWDAAPDLLGET